MNLEFNIKQCNFLLLYQPLKERWAHPMIHEKEVCNFKLKEINYTAIVIFLFSTLAIFSIAALYKIIFIAVIPFILLALFFPVFVIPWDVVLSNKRFILRRNFWNIGRFSKIINFKLKHLDTSSVEPRIKMLPLITGYIILSSISTPLIQFIVDGSLPFPLTLVIFFYIFDFLGLHKYSGEYFLTKLSQHLVDYLDPSHLFLGVFTALITTIALVLFLLGLPWRKSVTLRTKGGHSLRINVGFPEVLSNYLYGVGRSHKLKRKFNQWDWDVPLLDDEEVKYTGKVGLINKFQIIMAYFSLLLFIQSLLSTRLSWTLVLLIPVYLISLLLILQGVIFAKYYTRIRATNHRIIFQEEMRNISGIFGKRVYKYTDLPYENVQSFLFSRYTTISPSVFYGSLFIYLIGLIIAGLLQNTGFIIFVVVFVIASLAFNFATYTNLEFQTIGGGNYRVAYKLPFLLERISHRMEGHLTVYSKIFPNSLPEKKIIGILNRVRGIKRDEEGEEAHKVEISDLVDKNQKELAKWERMAPHKFAITGVVISVVVGIIIISWAFTTLSMQSGIIMIILSSLTLLVSALNELILERNSLYIYPNRIFRIRETLPYKLALLFGVLPFNSIEDLNLKYLTSIQYRLQSYNELPKIIQQSFALLISFFVAANQELFNSFRMGELLFIGLILFVIQIIPGYVQSLLKLIPRYTLIIQKRFRSLNIPHMKRLSAFVKHIEEAISR